MLYGFRFMFYRFQFVFRVVADVRITTTIDDVRVTFRFGDVMMAVQLVIRGTVDLSKSGLFILSELKQRECLKMRSQSTNHKFTISLHQFVNVNEIVYFNKCKLCGIQWSDWERYLLIPLHLNSSVV